ncbi:AAA family ATPase [Streptomyces sp. 549]|uniref:AAA family ATPase n=1 Tax=Streptomyces sp. 549 TaxID=3049076 RepID=UPI0024C39CAF|nr:AAA family ATPase [Streptomyces sp. 549]MDK1474678.1 AAA family ATPase [Streptomyces sp. 549]
MIIWVNGAFGSGKTTLVAELHRRLPAALVLDPEQVGFLLRGIVDVPTGDFQDLRLWRQQTAGLAAGLWQEYNRPVLVPMTLVDAGHLAEIFTALENAGTPLHHFFLRVPPDVLARRIDARTVAPHDPERDRAARAWCRAQVGRCVAAADFMPPGTVFLDGERPCRDLADEVLVRVGSGMRG